MVVGDPCNYDPSSPAMLRALKANTVHPDLSTITRCHSYDISYKYSYKCIRCDYKYVHNTCVRRGVCVSVRVCVWGGGGGGYVCVSLLLLFHFHSLSV